MLGESTGKQKGRKNRATVETMTTTNKLDAIEKHVSRATRRAGKIGLRNDEKNGQGIIVCAIIISNRINNRRRCMASGARSVGSCHHRKRPGNGYNPEYWRNLSVHQPGRIRNNYSRYSC